MNEILSKLIILRTTLRNSYDIVFGKKQKQPKKPKNIAAQRLRTSKKDNFDNLNEQNIYMR